MPTKNRKEDLRRAILSCFDQTVPVEIIVRDDGSTDGTDEMVRREFPMVNYARHEKSVGSIRSRNEAVAAASTAIIISLDDDAAFASPRTVEQTLQDFKPPRVGAVGMPYIDVLKHPGVEQVAPDKEHVWLTPFFRGCAAAWRRDVFLALGGYSFALFHHHEEPELCQRFLDAGFVTRLGTADPVHHYESPKRNSRMLASLTARNSILLGIMNAPIYMLPFHVIGAAANALLWGMRTGNTADCLRGALRGALDTPVGWHYRRPMNTRAYFLYRWLRRHPRATLEQVAHRLPVWRSDPVLPTP